MTTARTPHWQEPLSERLMSAAGATALRLLGKAASRPFTSALVIVMTAGTFTAASNALYGQPVRHPAPLMMETAAVVAPRVEPVEAKPEQQMPAQVPDSLGDASKLTPAPDPLQQATQTAAARNAAPEPAGEVSIGNQDVADLQAKLKQLGYYDGTVDGYYGPNTANAIRAFEESAGMTPKGAVTPEVLAAVAGAPAGNASAPASQPATPVPAPAPAAAGERPASPQANVAPSTTAEPDAIGQLVTEVAAAPAPAPESVQRTVETATNPAVDRQLILKVQRGLFQLGFLNSEIDGVYDEATARAIREFENYKSYRVTGEMSPALVDMLMETGAFN